MFVKNILLKTSIVGLCATTLLASATGYNSSSLTGGFSDTQLAPNIFEVNFAGNGYTGKERAKDFSILRGAELCLDHGYRYFGIKDKQVESQTSIGGSFNLYGGGIYSISRPYASQKIVCSKSKPRGFSYDARFIKKSIRDKYKLDEKKKDQAL